MRGYKKVLPICLLSHSSTPLPQLGLCLFHSPIHPSVSSKHSSITRHVYASFLLHCRPQSLSLSPSTPSVEAISHDTKAECSAMVVSLTPHQLNLHATGANVILSTTHPFCYCHLPKDSHSGLRACRRLPKHNRRRARTAKDARTWNRYAVLACHHCPNDHGPFWSSTIADSLLQKRVSLLGGSVGFVTVRSKASSSFPSIQ